MDRADYIRRVDAMDLPDELRQRLTALPSERKTRAHNVRPYDGRGTRRVREAAPYEGRGEDGPARAPGTTHHRSGRWGAIAAALVLVVGLGVAAPAILRAIAPEGGDIITPPMVTEVPAISDEELTELLAAEFPSPMENDTYSLLYSATQQGRTMGALLYRGGGHYVLGTIIVGVFDNETKAPIGDIRIHTGDLGEAIGVLSREQVVYLLWTNSMGRGDDWVAGLYAFSRGELTAVTELPPHTVEGTLPVGALTMLDPEKSADFWTDHKAAINGAGLDIYYRNPEYHYIRNHEAEEWLLACSIQFQFSTGPDAAAILTDGELTELLAAQFPGERKPEDTWKLLYSVPGEGVTMGVLEYVGVNEDDYRRGFLILGAFDNATAHPSGQIQLFGGTPFESREMLPYSTNESESGDGYFLCIRQNTGATPSSVYYYPTLYRFDGREVKEATSSPNAVFPAGTEDMFDSAKNEAFWQEHKIIIAPGGFELFRRNPDWNRPDVEQQPLWVYDAYVPLSHEFPDPRAMAEARNYFIRYYGGDMSGSSYYSIKSCELVPDYGVAFYGEDSSAYRVMLEDHEGGLERYFVFDGNMDLLNVATSDWASPWDSYEGALTWTSIEGVPSGGLFTELDAELRENLKDTGETPPYLLTPWVPKLYRSDLLEITTVTAPGTLLEQMLADGSIDRAMYDEVLGTEYICHVRPLDSTYPTGGGLRIGDTVERGRELFYDLSDNDTFIRNAGMDSSLTVTTENGVVTDIIVMASTRVIGGGVFY